MAVKAGMEVPPPVVDNPILGMAVVLHVIFGVAAAGVAVKVITGTKSPGQ